MVKTLYTIGHSTRPLTELVHMLSSNGVTQLVDVRTIPKSSTNPQGGAGFPFMGMGMRGVSWLQFNKEALEQQLPEQHGIQYKWMGKELGGLRKRDKSSEANAGWDNASFRGYADYMQTPDFRAGLQELLQLAEGPDCSTAIMRAEAVSFRCHRLLISDAAAVRGWQVLHITSPDKPPPAHKLTAFAVVQGDADGGPRITYPAYEHTPRQRRKSSSGSSSEGAGSSAGRSMRSKSRSAKRVQPD